MDWTQILQLLVAGILGGLIGMEREIRAKEAGIRTHFIVALGSALFMLISKYAFNGQSFDASRIAAQVVSGIGFIGAGVIIFQKNAVRGVTTAAGLWVAAAIGLACGAQMWELAVSAAILTLICLEATHFITDGISEVVIDIILPQRNDLEEADKKLREAGLEPSSAFVASGKAHLQIKAKRKERDERIKKILHTLEDFDIEQVA